MKKIKKVDAIRPSLDDPFRAVCFVCVQLHQLGKPVPTNSQYAQLARSQLLRFAKMIRRQMQKEIDGRYIMNVSIGQTLLPKILWVAILPVGRSVSSTPSVAICFGRSGEGAVVGLMRPALGQSPLQTVRRAGTPALRVDVDGTKPNTSYNDKFVNPMEFLASTFDSDAFVKHLRISLVSLGKIAHEYNVKIGRSRQFLLE